MSWNLKACGTHLGRCLQQAVKIAAQELQRCAWLQRKGTCSPHPPQVEVCGSQYASGPKDKSPAEPM